MAFSRHLETYPPSVVELFETACRANHDYIVPCESAKEAGRVRMMFYAIKYAIMHTPDHPLIPLAASRQLTIDRNNAVVFRSPANSPLATLGERLKKNAEQANKEPK